MRLRLFPVGRPLSWACASLVLTGAALVPLIPEPWRPYNAAMFGALGLYASARLSLAPAMALVFLGKTMADLLNYALVHPGDADYLPIWHVVLCFALYPLCGLLLRQTEHPLKIGGVAVLASVMFFAVTNFVSWLQQSLPYGYTFGGLMQSYWSGVPFYRGTLLGDVLGSAGLFGVHALMCRLYFPAERLALSNRPEAAS